MGIMNRTIPSREKDNISQVAETSRQSSLQEIAWKIISTPWLAEVIALLGLLGYLAQSWVLAHTNDSMVDEGAYLYKGYLFVTGQYTPFQEYGPWTNHMPLVFYIPGIVERFFGPGIRTGRYFAIFLGLLMMIGIWLLARKLGNRWWAAGAVLFVALNPALIKMYSIAVSQVLIACLLVWALYFVMGEKQKLWQIALGSILAAVMLLSRVNMAPVLPLLILYVFWQHGKKAGIIAAISGGLVVIIGHSLFWPGIMTVWARLLPPNLTPFLNLWRPAIPIGANSFSPDYSLSQRIVIFFQAFRFHFIPFLGVIGCLLLWSPKREWKSQFAYRASVFLLSLFIVLLMAHMMVTVFDDGCLYCLPAYLGFFFILGILLIVVSFSSWRKYTPWWYLLLVFSILLLLSAGIGYSTFDEVGKALVNYSDVMIPRFIIHPFKAEPGMVNLHVVLTNYFHADDKELERILPAFVGLLVGVLLLTLFAITTWIMIRRRDRGNVIRIHPYAEFAYWSITIVLCLAFMLTPSKLLSGGYSGYDCGWDTIQSYETAGRYLASVIPKGSLVYWDGGSSFSPLLYVPGIKIFPAQINGGYSFYIGGNSDTLAKMGLWNEQLASNWQKEADYILIKDANFKKSSMKDYVTSGQFDELAQTPQVSPCVPGSAIHIYHRKTQ
jgi:Dolichyl-phosphate-mannose-protein mannosyltransferase